MHTLSHYQNKDIDAMLMTERLKWGRGISTPKAMEKITLLERQRHDKIRNYKDVRDLDLTLGNYLLLVRDRELWSSYCCDDCTHWI